MTDVVYQGMRGFPNGSVLVYHSAHAMKFRDLIANALDIVFPSQCVGCDAPLARGALLCPACESAVPIARTFFCSVCLSRLPSAPAHTGQANVPPQETHPLCHPKGFLFGAATEYQNDTVRELVHALKFRSARAAAEPLARMLAQYIRELGIASPDTLMVPVPLSRTRERTRGFNQAELIAKLAGAELNITVVPNVLRRIRDTKAQSDIHERKERLKNMRGAFALDYADIVRGRTVIVVDDVRTSGATLGEAVATLYGTRPARTGRPKHIYGIVVARA